MNRILPIITIFVFSAIFISCEKAPRYAIGESDMEDLLVDIYKAEAYIEAHYLEFADDTSKMLLKQSVFMKHGVTPEKFDTSMKWYSKNIPVYMDVYDNVQKRLEKERNELDISTGNIVATHRKTGTGKTYKNFGDSADLWMSARQFIITENIENGILPFELKTNQESQKGDKYSLKMLVVNNKTEIKALVALLYNDDSYTFIERRMSSNGWLDVAVQGDSLKSIKNVFGYIKYGAVPHGEIVYVDSILLLRTHLDRNTYNIINTQKVLDRHKIEKTDKTATDKTSAESKKPESGNMVRPQSEGASPSSRAMLRRRLSEDNNKSENEIHDVRGQTK